MDDGQACHVTPPSLPQVASKEQRLLLLSALALAIEQRTQPAARGSAASRTDAGERPPASLSPQRLEALHDCGEVGLLAACVFKRGGDLAWVELAVA